MSKPRRSGSVVEDIFAVELSTQLHPPVESREAPSKHPLDDDSFEHSDEDESEDGDLPVPENADRSTGWLA